MESCGWHGWSYDLLPYITLPGAGLLDPRQAIHVRDSDNVSARSAHRHPLAFVMVAQTNTLFYLA